MRKAVSVSSTAHTALWLELRSKGLRAVMQYVLVCASDAVLAKKVRFLLARDECEVEILSDSGNLERRLEGGNISLLILSRMLEGVDAIDRLAHLDPALAVPPTIVLGGTRAVTADFIRLIPDPIDTQSIYRVASELLAAEKSSEIFSSEEDLTHIAVEPPVGPRGKRTEKAEKTEAADDDQFAEVTGLEEIAGRLDRLENRELNDAFEIEEAPNVESRSSRARGSEGDLVTGRLEPARFAKALYRAWRDQATGALVVTRDEEVLTLFFEDGAPVQVVSSIPGDPLGRQLVARGRISQAQYAEGAMRSVENGVSLGDALVELGFFTTEELARELGMSAKEQIIACFEARRGMLEFNARGRPTLRDRPYRLEIGLILAEGIRKHADRSVLKEINGDIEQRYFRLRSPADELKSTFGLSGKEMTFLSFGGRAYNFEDASEVSGLDREAAQKLVALLRTSEEIDDFTPGAAEFESRIREERQRTRDLELRASQIPTGTSGIPRMKESSFPPRPVEPEPISAYGSHPPASSGPPGDSMSRFVPPMGPPPPHPPSYPASQPPREAHEPQPQFSRPPVSSPPSGDAEIPRMPVPAHSEDGLVPRPLIYAKPLPRGPDGLPVETPERTLSREHFQRGVTLLGQGNFASAEDAFRDAVALCSEEHVYLIGLARAIYYNPSYRADGKVPVLKAIVGRASQLSPDDKRVVTLSAWVQHAEHHHQLSA